MNGNKKLLGTTIIAAIAASLCCIVPVLAFIAGVSGFASTFVWVEPFRPYLIAITLLVLTIAWYHKLQPKKEKMDCDCEDRHSASRTGKQKFVDSRKFLTIVTFFTLMMLAFPYYSHVFYPKANREVVYMEPSSSDELTFSIKGMTCLGCEAHIENEVNKLDGIIETKADYQEANIIVKYNKARVSKKEIEEAILRTGYKIIGAGKERSAIKRKTKIKNESNISFYAIGLVCNAAPNIGCGSRSKPILLELEKAESITQARLNREGTLIGIVWGGDTDAKFREMTVDSIFSKNKLSAKKVSPNHYDEYSISFNSNDYWLRGSDVDELSKEEAGIIANRLVDVFKEKGTLTTKQEEKLKIDIENVFYDFFLNFDSLEQLSDTEVYRQLMLKITGLSEEHIESNKIPNIDSLLNACTGHSANCKQSCCTNGVAK